MRIIGKNNKLKLQKLKRGRVYWLTIVQSPYNHTQVNPNVPVPVNFVPFEMMRYSLYDIYLFFLMYLFITFGGKPVKSQKCKCIKLVTDASMKYLETDLSSFRS